MEGDKLNFPLHLPKPTGSLEGKTLASPRDGRDKTLETIGWPEPCYCSCACSGFLPQALFRAQGCQRQSQVSPGATAPTFPSP